MNIYADADNASLIHVEVDVAEDGVMIVEYLNDEGTHYVLTDLLINIHFKGRPDLILAAHGDPHGEGRAYFYFERQFTQRLSTKPIEFYIDAQVEGLAQILMRGDIRKTGWTE